LDGREGGMWDGIDGDKVGEIPTKQKKNYIEKQRIFLLF
jgi:hypothetical protein